MSPRALSSCRDAARLAVAIVAIVALGGSVHAAVAGAPAGDGPVQPLVVGVTVNGSLVADAQLVYRAAAAGDTRVWLPIEQAKAWRLDTESRPRRQIDRRAYAGYCTDADRCELDEASAQVTLDLPAAGFVPLRLGPAAGPAAAVAASAPAAATGAFLNYDLSTWKYGRPGVSGLLDGRVYSGLGHGAFQIGSIYAGERLSHTVGRAVWQIDQPEQRRTIQLGSIAIPDTALGAGLPLTGARIGSNSSLQPLAPPTLRPVVDGIADRSTRTDVFVDGQYRQTALIPYGRYSIELLPQFTGRGDIEVVSTDPSGVKTRMFIPYYQTPSMLAPGRSEWSLDTGFLTDDGRRRIDTDSHRAAVASGWLRTGVTRWLTAQGQVLIGPRTTRVAASADTVNTRWGASSIGATWQRAPYQGSKLWLAAGHEFVSRDVSASVRSEQLLGRCTGGNESGGALADRLSRPCSHSSATLASSIGQRGSVAAAADLLREADGRRSLAVGVNARWQIGPFSQVAASLQRVAFDHRGATVVGISYSRPLDGRYTGQSSVERRGDDGTALQWAAQRLPTVDGSEDGPRFQTYGAIGERRSELGTRWSGEANHFAWRAETRVDRRGLSGAAGIDGSMGYAEGHVFTARRIDDAFIVVDAGLPGLPVMLDNRLVAHTDEDGLSIVTGARARQENSISVDVSSLPIRYAMPRDQLMVTPGIGAGALARFDLSDGGIAIEVRDARGERLPSGAAATVSSQTLVTAVTSRSEVFIDRSDREATIKIEWNGQRCVVAYRPGDAPAGGYRCGAR